MRLRRWQADGEKSDCKGRKAVLERLHKEHFMLDCQMQETKKEVHRPEVVKQEFIQENEQTRPKMYAR